MKNIERENKKPIIHETPKNQKLKNSENFRGIPTENSFQYGELKTESKLSELKNENNPRTLKFESPLYGGTSMRSLKDSITQFSEKEPLTLKLTFSPPYTKGKISHFPNPLIAQSIAIINHNTGLLGYQDEGLRLFRITQDNQVKITTIKSSKIFKKINFFRRKFFGFVLHKRS